MASSSLAGHIISVPHFVPHFLWALGVSQWTIQDEETLQPYDLVSKFGLLGTLLEVGCADSLSATSFSFSATAHEKIPCCRIVDHSRSLPAQ
jgi:hypothetical protein